MYSEYPLVTIFSFVRNAAGTIRRSVESVLAQDYPNFEFVIQDGASDDGTVEIIRGYNDPRIKLVSEPDNGPLDGLLRLGPRLTGEIIGSCLADEELLPGAIAWGVQMLKQNPDAAGVYGDFYTTTMDGTVTDQCKAPDWDIRRYMFLQFSVPFGASFFRGDCYRPHHHRMEFEAGETGFWLHLGAHHPILHIPHWTAKYTWHEKSQGTAQPKIQRFLARKRVIENFCDDPNTPPYLRALKERAVCHAHTWLVFQAAQSGDWDIVEQHLRSVMETTLESPYIPRIVNRLHEKAVELFGAKQFDKAYRLVKMMTEAGIKVADIHLIQSLILGSTGHIDQARQSCRQELLINPSSKQARELLEKLLSMQPASPLQP